MAFAHQRGLERRGREHRSRIHRERYAQSDEVRRGQPSGQQRRKSPNGDAEQRSETRQQRHDLRDVRPALRRPARQEVVQRLRQPELPDEQQRLRDQEELLVGSKGMRIEHPHQDERQAEGERRGGNARKHQRSRTTEGLHR